MPPINEPISIQLNGLTEGKEKHHDMDLLERVRFLAPLAWEAGDL